jgi:hypothetical protein
MELNMPKINLIGMNNQPFTHKPFPNTFHAAIFQTESAIDECLELGLSSNVCFSFFISALENMNDPIFMANHQALIQEIRRLAAKDTSDRSALIDFMKIIQLFRVPGIHHIEVVHPLLSNQYTFDEINFPESLMPNAYVCEIGMQVMSAPCKINGGIIDRATLLTYFKSSKRRENPFTREIMQDITVDTQCVSEINLLLKKASFIYYSLGGAHGYEQFSTPLLDKTVSYDELKKLILIEGHFQPNARLFFSGVQKNTLTHMPPKSIMDIFIIHKMHCLYPSRAEFNTLIQSIVDKVDETAAFVLLDSPYVDVARVDTSPLEQMLGSRLTERYML